MIRSLLSKFRRFLWQHEFLRLLIIIIFIWIMGAFILWIFEHEGSPDEFGTVARCFWTIAVYLFSGLDSGEPQTTAGRIVVTIILVLSLGVVGIFTGTVASIFVERKIGGRRFMPPKKMKDHIVICNWNKKGMNIIRELRAKALKEMKPIVVISTEIDVETFPELDELEDFRNVFLIKGEPTNEVNLTRANIQHCFSCIILSQTSAGEYADAQSILISMTIKHLCSEMGCKKVHVVTEAIDPKNFNHMMKAGCDEIVSSGDFALRIISQSALTPGLSEVYSNLVTVSEETNEIYQLPVPPQYYGKSFEELGIDILRKREKKNPAILIGVKSDNKIMLNPKRERFASFKEGDEIFLVSFTYPDLDFLSK
jgi:voltage-gated potassium channel